MSGELGKTKAAKGSGTGADKSGASRRSAESSPKATPSPPSAPHSSSVRKPARTVHSDTAPVQEAHASGTSNVAAGHPRAPRATPRQTSVRRTAPRARRMNLSLVRVDAWSVAKVTFLLSVAGGIIQIIAFALIWGLLNMVGVFEQINQIFTSTGLDSGNMNLTDIFSLSKVLSAVTIFSIGEVIIFTLLATIFALLYNAVSALVGGVHVTLGDD